MSPGARAGLVPGRPRKPRDTFELAVEDREWARRTVAALPPVTDWQRDVLIMLLRGLR